MLTLMGRTPPDSPGLMTSERRPVSLGINSNIRLRIDLGTVAKSKIEAGQLNRASFRYRALELTRLDTYFAVYLTYLARLDDE